MWLRQPGQLWLWRYLLSERNAEREEGRERERASCAISMTTMLMKKRSVRASVDLFVATLMVDGRNVDHLIFSLSLSSLFFRLTSSS